MTPSLPTFIYKLSAAKLAALTLMTFASSLFSSSSYGQAETAAVGDVLTFSASADGYPSPTFQWQKNGVAIPGATAVLHTLSAVALTDAGAYSVLATNEVGSAISPVVTLSVQPSLTNPAVLAAPTITVHPKSKQTVLAGSPVTFTVAASGSPAPTFQWQLYGVALPGKTGDTLTLPSATVYDAGGYSAVATNSSGEATSNWGFLIVNGPVSPPLANIAPTIETQPSNQTANFGGTVTFTVAATGTPAPTFQWKKNGGDIIGATGSTLTLSSVTTAHAGSYTAVAVNVVGSVTSTAATLTVTTPPPANVAPVMTTQPSSQTAVVGASVSFTAAASGTPAPTFQWAKNGANISGATAASYVLSSLTTANAGSYTVVATNAAGSVTSSAAILTVTAAPSVNAVPVISTQPVSKTAAAGATVTFTVTASGTPAPTYQWRKNGTNISGATDATLTLASLTTQSAGNYTVVAKNKMGSVTSAVAILTVPLAPQITSQPKSQTIREGNSVTFVVNAATYQWFKDGIAIAGATSASYQIPTVLGEDAGKYTVVLTSEGGEVSSSPATLTVAK